jgi:photosystem I subunit 3
VQKNDAVSQIGSILAATTLAAAMSLTTPSAAQADIAGLTPCSESKAYAKVQKKEIKTLERRLKQVIICVKPSLVSYFLALFVTKSPTRNAQYEADSAPALALKATMERTKSRFANYAKAGLLCGNDGLPHLISDPGLALKYGHAGEVFVSIALHERLTGSNAEDGA